MFLMLLPLLQLAVWEVVSPPVLHQGSWQSCNHEERVLEHRQNGRLQWELHLGPDDEFALYNTRVDGPDHSHEGPQNLLGPQFHVNDHLTWRGKRQWSVKSLHLWISIVSAGGSRDDCMSFYIRIERKE